ncbi:MAG TPA: helix-turn-helix domain-containing protein [Tepidisphaeraceae bacterium]|nr:helix-turn-helix domain-containing protein [Tepidisphaeraceae bacterium]
MPEAFHHVRPTTVSTGGHYAQRYAVAAPEYGLALLAEAQVEPDARHVVHTHGEAQLIGVLSGRLAFDVHPANAERHRLELAAGDACVLAAGVPHAVADCAGAAVRLLDVRLSTAAGTPTARFLADLPGPPLRRCGAAVLAARAADLRGAVRDTGARRAARLLTAVWRLLADVAAAPTAGGPPSPVGSGDGCDDRRLALADELMRDRIGDPLDVSVLARAVGVSRVHLTRLYLKHRGTTPAAHLRQLRVARAGDLLSTTTLSVKEVAAVCGFATPEHFARVFRAATGRTPTAHQGRRG